MAKPKKITDIPSKASKANKQRLSFDASLPIERKTWASPTNKNPMPNKTEMMKVSFFIDSN